MTTQPRRQQGFWSLLLIMWLPLAGLGGVVAGKALTDSGGQPELVAPPQETYTIKGKVVLHPGQYVADGETCRGDGDYAEVQEGGVAGAIDVSSGEGISSAYLGPGMVDGDMCVFSFTLDVPTGKGTYGISLPRVGELRYPESKLRNLLEVAISAKAP